MEISWISLVLAIIAGSVVGSLISILIETALLKFLSDRARRAQLKKLELAEAQVRAVMEAGREKVDAEA